MILTKSAYFAISTAVLLSACGGGGDEGSQTSPPTSFPLAASVTAYSQGTYQFNLSAVVNGNTLTVNFTRAPSAAGTFEGRSTATALETAILKVNGVVFNQMTVRSYFDANPYRSYGSVEQNTGEYTVRNQQTNFPQTARIGDIGTVGTRVIYTNSTKSTVKNTATVTWSLEPDTQSTALFCTNIVSTDKPLSTASDCSRIDASGNTLGLVLKLLVDGQIVTFR